MLTLVALSAFEVAALALCPEPLNRASSELATSPLLQARRSSLSRYAKSLAFSENRQGSRSYDLSDRQVYEPAAPPC